MKLNLMVCALVGAMCMAPCLTNAEEPVLKIGALLHLSGEFAPMGDAFRKGVELAVAEANASGGISGHRVEVVYEDTQYKPQVAHTGAKKLLNSDKIAGAVVTTLTEIEAAGPEFERAGVPAIVLWDASVEIEEIGKHVFAIGPWAPASGEVPAQFARDRLEAKTAVVLYSNTPWSSSVQKAFEERFTAAGGRILESVAFNPGDSEFRTVLARARALSPDVIYAPMDDSLVAFFKQVRDLGLKMPVLTSDIVDDELIREAGRSLEGIYQAQATDPAFPATERMLRAYREHFGVECDKIPLTAWGYDGAKLLMLAAERANFDRFRVSAEIYKIKNWEGATGTVSFNERGSAPKFPRMFQVQSAKLVPIEASLNRG